MLRTIAAILMLLIASGCSSLNLPVSQRFPAIVDRPAEARVFFDVNGTFYPTDWQEVIGAKRLAKAGSLLNAATAADQGWLQADEQAQLRALGGLIRGKERVFILVHGFNIDEADASLAFDLVERRIAFTPRDAVIRVHWDGMLGTGVGGATIWFSAVGNSQVVGLRGLRKVLELASGQELILISHSRGASVVLSALSDPPFDPKFRLRTEMLGFGGASFLRPPPLSDRNNRIHAILLAPAVGYPDFWQAACELTPKDAVQCGDPPVDPTGATAGTRCPQFRAFTPQLKSLRYTTNRGDDTLQKKAFTLRRYFNATDLGFDETVGRKLHACYDFEMEGYPIVKQHRHAFELYAQDPELARMLMAIGVAAN